MKRFPEFVTTFLSYYLASAAITALMMLTVFFFVIELFNNLNPTLNTLLAIRTEEAGYQAFYLK